MAPQARPCVHTLREASELINNHKRSFGAMQLPARRGPHSAASKQKATTAAVEVLPVCLGDLAARVPFQET